MKNKTFQRKKNIYMLKKRFKNSSIKFWITITFKYREIIKNSSHMSNLLDYLKSDLDLEYWDKILGSFGRNLKIEKLIQEIKSLPIDVQEEIRRYLYLQLENAEILNPDVLDQEDGVIFEKDCWG